MIQSTRTTYSAHLSAADKARIEVSSSRDGSVVSLVDKLPVHMLYNIASSQALRPLLKSVLTTSKQAKSATTHATVLLAISRHGFNWTMRQVRQPFQGFDWRDNLAAGVDKGCLSAVDCSLTLTHCTNTFPLQFLECIFDNILRRHHQYPENPRCSASRSSTKGDRHSGV